MTQRYLGGIITANPTEPSENFSDSAASGMWTMQEALSFSKAGDWPDPTSINPSKFVENLFSTYTYAGTGSSLAINNGIDLSDEGGLVWIKRTSDSRDHGLFDTERGVNQRLYSNYNLASSTNANSLTSFNSNGFTVGSESDVNGSGEANVSWTFRKQPKFFDIVTYTGDGATDREVSHNLGTTIGFMLVKRTDNTSNWACIAYNGTNYSCLALNSTAAQLFSSATSNYTSTMFKPHDVFQQFTDTPANDRMNVDGASYVAYLFAHNNNDGGFGSTGDQDIIKCGSYTGNGSTSSINLGFEPQWILIKNATKANTDFILFDAIRGIYTGGNDTFLFPRQSAGDNAAELIELSATGFNGVGTNEHTNENGHTFVYVAIRRGIMKAPTAGTQVFFPDLITANQSGITATGIGFSPDVIINLVRSNANYGQQISNRLTGPTKQLFTNYNSAEGTTNGTALVSFDMDGYTLGSDSAGTGWNAYSGYTSVKLCFKRAPSFLDVVAYAGTGSTHNINHNLGVAPEMILLKNRTSSGGGAGWVVGVASLGNDEGALHNDNGFAAYNNITTYSTTTFTAGSGAEEINKSGENYVAYLFATLSGVSKVGTYSGTGSDVDVDCGFTSGARFVLAKRTDSSGGWYVWDSARGIVSGNDPYMQLNSASAEVTNTDYIDPLSSGFTITSNAGSDLNHNGGSYVFLAIA